MFFFFELDISQAKQSTSV